MAFSDVCFNLASSRQSLKGKYCPHLIVNVDERLSLLQAKVGDQFKALFEKNLPTLIHKMGTKRWLVRNVWGMCRLQMLSMQDIHNLGELLTPEAIK